MLWCFRALRYCVGHDSRAFGNHCVSGSLKGLCMCHLHMPVVLLCSAYRAFSFSLLFQGSPPLSPPFILYFYIVFYIGSQLFFQFSVIGCWDGGWGRVFFWQAGLVAGLQVGQALRCSGCLGLGSAVPAPHVPWHRTSICDEGINVCQGYIVLFCRL